MKRVGIIGGMGPEATVDLFFKIVKNTPANCDQEHIPIVIDNYPQIPDRTLFLKGKGKSPLPFLLESVERLQRAGVDCLCMACNTAHYFINELKKKAKVPFISMIEAVVDRIEGSKNLDMKVGLLATDGTVISRIYHKALEDIGITIKDFDRDVQSIIMESIYLLKGGKKKEAVDNLKKVIEVAIDSHYDILIAGCTEIPVLVSCLEVDNKGIEIIDSTLELAKKVVKYCVS